jgi:hypothetical protein
VAVGKVSLTAQHPLLDGGEGELLPRTSDDMELDTHYEQKISPTGANTSSLPPSGFSALDASNFSGFEPPSLDSTGGVVTGADTPKHRIENKRRRKATLANQDFKSQWTIYQGEFELPVPPTPLEMHWGEMCKSGQAKLVAWDSIKDNPPVELKISPIAAIPHKSKQFRSILDLSFNLRLKQEGIVPGGQCNYYKNSPQGRYRPTRSLPPHSHHSCLCGGRGGRTHLYHLHSEAYVSFHAWCLKSLTNLGQVT